MRELNLGESQGVRTLETDIRRGLHELGRQTLGLDNIASGWSCGATAGM